MARRNIVNRKHRRDALSNLDYHWGEAYKISSSGGIFRAQRRDDGQVVVADTPELLIARIRQNYEDRPVPREFSGTDEHEAEVLDQLRRMYLTPQKAAKSPSFSRLQALEDAICYRTARLAEPCPGCGPDEQSRCNEHACDVMLIAAYRRDVQKLAASMRAELEHVPQVGAVHYLPGRASQP